MKLIYQKLDIFNIFKKIHLFDSKSEEINLIQKKIDNTIKIYKIQINKLKIIVFIVKLQLQLRVK